MKRRFIKGLSVATALCLSVSNPVAAIAQETSSVTTAENSDESTSNDDYFDEDKAHEYAVENSEKGKTVTNEKTINSDDSGIYAENGSTVNQKGDINVKEEAIRVEDGAEVNVTGNINSSDTNVYKDNVGTTGANGAVKASDGKVSVTGNITVNRDGKVDVESSGVTAGYDASIGASTSVTVNGNITVSSKAEEDSSLSKDHEDHGIVISSSTGIAASAKEENSHTSVTVNGDIITKETDIYEGEKSESSGRAIFVHRNNGKTVVKVNGDASGKIDIFVNDGRADIIIDGTLKTDGPAISYSVTKMCADLNDSTAKNPDAETIEDGLNGEENITIWKLESDFNHLVDAYYRDFTATKTNKSGKTVNYQKITHIDDKEAEIRNNINYIIRTDEVSHGTIKLSGVKVVDGYNTAHEEQIVKINVETAEGYKLDAVKNGNSILTRNADGSYNLVVPRGGGVQLSAVLSAIQKNNEASSSGSGSSSSSSGRSSGGSGSSSGSGSINIPTVTDTNAATDTTTTTTTSTSGATVTTTTSQSEGNSFVSSNISIGDKTANVSVSSSSVNGQDIVIKTIEGDISGVTFEGVGTVSADGTKVTTKDGEYSVVSAPMLFISTAERTGCFVDLNTGKPISTGKIEKFYQLGEDGQLHDHWVDTTGHFYFGPEDMKHYYGAPAELSNYEDGSYCLFNREGTFLGVRSGKWDDLWKICNEG